MFVKCIDWWIKVPKNNTPCGYDFEVGDWVTPYGKGKVSDFIFTLKTRFKAMNDRESSYKLTFKNQKDGIMEYKTPSESSPSAFTLPYKCPENGFKRSLYKYIRFLPNNRGYIVEQNLNNNNIYLFRVRTKVDPHGNIVSANYGVVSSEIMVYADDKETLIKFSYKFNPDKHSRSLEYNNINLFKDRDSYGRKK
jgi:hypothetical protein